MKICRETFKTENIRVWMCLRCYLDDVRELLQRLFVSGFHSLQVLGFDNLLLNPRASCIHHHLQEFLLLRVKNSAETTSLAIYTKHFYVMLCRGALPELLTGR